MNFQPSFPQGNEKTSEKSFFWNEPHGEMALEKYHYIGYDAGRTCWNALLKPEDNQAVIWMAYAFFIFS